MRRGRRPWALLRPLWWGLFSLGLAAGCGGARSVGALSPGAQVAVSARTFAPGQEAGSGVATPSGPRVLVIWASWCGRCVELIEALSETLPSGSLWAQSVDADPRLAQAAAARLPAGVVHRWDPQGTIGAEEFRLRRVPAVLIIGSDGRLVWGWDAPRADPTLVATEARRIFDGVVEAEGSTHELGGPLD